MLNTRNKFALTAKKIAYSAIMTALLIGGQIALGFVAGVEVVTVLLLSFSCCFGVICGVLTAIAFSLLRCFIWGFYPTVIILYLLYYPVFALSFGIIGKINNRVFDEGKAVSAIVVNVICLALAAVCICAAAFNLIKISVLYRTTIIILLYVIAGLSIAIALSFNAIFVMVRRKILKDGKILRLFFLASVAAVFTVCFSLLDDVITPLFVGMSKTGALAYFYASFTAMLPQVICTIVSVSALYYPLYDVMNKALGNKTPSSLN